MGRTENAAQPRGRLWTLLCGFGEWLCVPAAAFLGKKKVKIGYIPYPVLRYKYTQHCGGRSKDILFFTKD
jgi:hypothetical protein